MAEALFHCDDVDAAKQAAGLAENFDLFVFDLTQAQMAAIATLDEGERCGPDPAQFNLG